MKNNLKRSNHIADKCSVHQAADYDTKDNWKYSHADEYAQTSQTTGYRTDMKHMRSGSDSQTSDNNVHTEQLQHAVIMSEILSQPVCKRRRHSRNI